MKKHPKLKRIFIFIAAVFGILLISVAVIYINLKSFTVKELQSAAGQEVYIMGTFHKDHFEPLANYSMEEMLNAIENIDPDVVFIEAREESYEGYGVVDGPVDMCVAYCYCKEHDIPVEPVDYWVVDNEHYQQNTTTDDRDDHIHQNIMEKLDSYDGKKVLVICGFGHLHPQVSRLVEDGFEKERISHISKLFKSNGKEFSYPSEICEVWEGRARFYAYTYPETIQADASINDEVKAQWPVDENHQFYDSQMKYCDLFNSNQLYNTDSSK